MMLMFSSESAHNNFTQAPPRAWAVVVTKLIGPSVQSENASNKPAYALYLVFPVLQ